MSEDNKVVNLVTSNKEDEEIKKFDGVALTYSTGSVEKIVCDYFGYSEDMPGFIVFWKDGADTPSSFINIETIRSISLTMDGERLKEHD